MRLFRTFLLATAGLFSAQIGAAATAAPVLMISIDGLRPADVLHDRERGLNLPNLRALAAGGAYASGLRGVLPTVTYPNHTTLVTGVSPARHGIVNNLTFDPQGRNAGGWYWYASDLHAPTLWDAVHAAGRRTASLGWPVTVGLRSIDANIPEYWRARTSEDAKLERVLATPGLIETVEAATGAKLDMGDTSPEQDAEKTKAALWIVRTRPAFFTLHLSSLDHQQHVYGPESTEGRSALTRIDEEVGMVVRAARAAQPDLVVAIVSDHGFAPVAHDINLAAAFVQAGLMQVDAAGSVVRWDAAPWNAGGSAAVVLARKDDAALRARVAALLTTMAADPASGVGRVIDQAGIARMGAAPEADFFVDARIGYQFGGAVTGPLVSAGTAKGTHGYFPEHPEMRATLILSGPSVTRKGDLGDVDARDVAPTLAKLLGVTLKGAEGHPLF